METAALELLPQMADRSAVQATSGHCHFPEIAAVHLHPFAERECKTHLRPKPSLEYRLLAHGPCKSRFSALSFKFKAPRQFGDLLK
jgi:hypothetical protein